MMSACNFLRHFNIGESKALFESCLWQEKLLAVHEHFLNCYHHSHRPIGSFVPHGSTEEKNWFKMTSGRSGAHASFFFKPIEIVAITWNENAWLFIPNPNRQQCWKYGPVERIAYGLSLESSFGKWRIKMLKMVAIYSLPIQLGLSFMICFLVVRSTIIDNLVNVITFNSHSKSCN